jgi:hypothetical protein
LVVEIIHLQLVSGLVGRRSALADRKKVGMKARLSRCLRPIRGHANCEGSDTGPIRASGYTEYRMLRRDVKVLRSERCSIPIKADYFDANAQATRGPKKPTRG